MSKFFEDVEVEESEGFTSEVVEVDPLAEESPLDEGAGLGVTE